MFAVAGAQFWCLWAIAATCFRASAALAQNRGVATIGDSVIDGFSSLLIMRTETEKDRLRVHTSKETKIQIQLTCLWAIASHGRYESGGTK